MTKILIAPGHDQAYNYFLNTNEAKENLRWCLSLYNKLKGKPGIEVNMTRWDNNIRQDMDAKMRMSEGYDIYLSVHSNAGGGTGAQMYCDVVPGYQDTALANAIMEAHCKANDIANRGLFYITTNWKQLPGPAKGYSNYFYEIKHCEAKVPLLFERFFHDSPSDRAKSLSDAQIEASTSAVANAIIRLKGTGAAPVAPSPTPTTSPSTSPTIQNDPVKWLSQYLNTYGTEIQDTAFGKGRRDNYCAAGTSLSYIRTGVKLPRIYTWVDDLRNYFISKGAYKTRASGYKPERNDSIFFDFEPNGVGNHVGLVEYSTNTTVFTEEPNAGDAGKVLKRSFALTNPNIMGYGVYSKIKPSLSSVIIPAPSPAIPPNAERLEMPYFIGYVSTDAADKMLNGKDYPSGEYFVYKKSGEDYYNLTKKYGTPGAWVKFNKVRLTKYIQGYVNTADAKARKNGKLYSPGLYYVYRAITEFTNITKNPAYPGAWINTGDLDL